MTDQNPSPLVGEVGGGRPASAGQKTPLLASSAKAADAPPPNPPHKGEGLKRLNLPANATARARSFRRTMTDAERVLWRALRSALPDYHWRKQIPFGPYIVDFCSHRAKLVIEVDGGQHAEGGDRDATRTRFLEAEGYRIIRFWNNDVFTNREGVIQAIELALLPILPGEGS